MVLPIIGGAVLLGYLTFGKELFGPKLFHQILTVLILLSVGIVGYFLYKMYSMKADVENILKNKLAWVTGGAAKKTEAVLKTDERYEDLAEVSKDVIWSGEMITQLFGGSAYTAGQTTAQKSYDDFLDRYGVDAAELYEEQSAPTRGLITFGDYITAGKATDLGHKFGTWLQKIKGE